LTRLKQFFTPVLFFLILFALGASSTYAQDTTKGRANDTTRFPIKDRVGDPFTYNSNNPFNFSDTSIIKRDVQYDPKTKQYYIVEKIGNSYYRTPTYLTFEEMMRFKARQSESDYFRKRANTLSVLNRKVERPKLKTYDRLLIEFSVLDQTD
jgi:hypothetical protein